MGEGHMIIQDHMIKISPNKTWFKGAKECVHVARVRIPSWNSWLTWYSQHIRGLTRNHLASMHGQSEEYVNALRERRASFLEIILSLFLSSFSSLSHQPLRTNRWPPYAQPPSALGTTVKPSFQLSFNQKLHPLQFFPETVKSNPIQKLPT